MRVSPAAAPLLTDLLLQIGDPAPRPLELALQGGSSQVRVCEIQ